MSLFGIIMDGVLMLLLVSALAFGVRLDKRLKALRAGQEDFARAVADLDQAAIKAHESLNILHDGADESQELLHGRIMVARDLIQKLDQRFERAERLQIELERSLNDGPSRAQPPIAASSASRVPESRLAEPREERLGLNRRPETVRSEIQRPETVRPEPRRSAPVPPEVRRQADPIPGTLPEADRLELLRQAIRANRLDVVDADDLQPRRQNHSRGHPEPDPAQDPYQKEPRPMHRPAMRTRRMVLEREATRAGVPQVERPQSLARSADPRLMDERLKLTETALAELNEVLGSFAADERSDYAANPAPEPAARFSEPPAQTPPRTLRNQRTAPPPRGRPADDLFADDDTYPAARRGSPGDF